MPIKNALGKVIGVSQLVNKLDHTTFNKNDENLFEVRFTCICSSNFVVICADPVTVVKTPQIKLVLTSPDCNLGFYSLAKINKR